jgi:hypothetical protein
VISFTPFPLYLQYTFDTSLGGSRSGSVRYREVNVLGPTGRRASSSCKQATVLLFIVSMKLGGGVLEHTGRKAQASNERARNSNRK